jgi:hypothetical protein
MIAHVALAVLVVMSVIGTIPANSEPKMDSNGYLFVPLAPISFKYEFQKESTIPLKFHLFDPSGAPVKDAYAWILVNDEPGRSSGKSNHYNEFRLNGATYTFNFDTKPYSVDPGPRDLRLTIEVMIGSENPIFLLESFDITLL